MKLIFISLCLMYAGTAYAETCAEKRKSIEDEIQFAIMHKNTQRIEGLQTALDHLNANCTDEKLLLNKEKKIKEKEEDVKEAQEELDEAVREGKSQKKIEKKKQKLKEELLELEKVKSKK